MEAIAKEDSYEFDPLARLSRLIDESREARERYERLRANDFADEEAQADATPFEQKRVANRNQIAPIGRLHRLLRQAYVHTDASNDASRSGVILERAQLYREKCLFKSCGKCDGEGKIEPKPSEVAKWQERARIFATIMTAEEFEARFPLPMTRDCPRCHGDGTQLKGHREVTVRPKGSSVQTASEQGDDPVGLVQAAQAGRIARRVSQMDARHGVVLQAYYGDSGTVSSLAHAHGRLVLLYPLTETGTALLEEADEQDPWKFLSEFMSKVSDEDRRLDADMQGEAYQLLCDATDTWDEAVAIEIPNWSEVH